MILVLNKPCCKSWGSGFLTLFGLQKLRKSHKRVLKIDEKAALAKGGFCSFVLCGFFRCYVGNFPICKGFNPEPQGGLPTLFVLYPFVGELLLA